MKIIYTIKSWLIRLINAIRNRDQKQATSNTTKTVEIPNGRVAVVDNRGNFVGWKVSQGDDVKK